MTHAINYAVLENGCVREIVKTDSPLTHAQRENFRQIPQDGDPQRFVGMEAKDLPSVTGENVKDEPGKVVRHSPADDLQAHSYDTKAREAAAERDVGKSKTVK